MDEHAKLSASGWAKWLNCPAALALESIIGGGDESSSFADEGTAAHEILEKCLRDKQDPASYLNKTIEVAPGRVIDVNQEMIDAVEVAAEYVQRLSPRNAFYEEKVEYTDIAPEGYGTADILLEVNEKVAPGEKVNTLYVIDFKYGKGIRVDADQNGQGMLYALGALRSQSIDMFFEAPIERVIVVIIQPRMDNISEFEISVDDLEAWGQAIKPKAQLAYDLLQTVNDIEYKDGYYSSPTLTAGDYFKPSKKACQWCKGKRQAKCRAQALAGYTAAVDGFQDIGRVKKEDLKNPLVLKTDELADVYRSMSVFKSFLENVTGEIIKRLENGETVPGLALGEKLGPRKWSMSSEDLTKALRSAGLQKKHYEKIGVISPTEAQKILKKIKPKDHKKRYDKLAEAAVIREPKTALLEIEGIPEQTFTNEAGDDDLLR